MNCCLAGGWARELDGTTQARVARRLKTATVAARVAMAWPGSRNAGVRRGLAHRPILVGPLPGAVYWRDGNAEKLRWYCPTPGWLVYEPLAVTGLLFPVELAWLAGMAQGLRRADTCSWRASPLYSS